MPLPVSMLTFSMPLLACGSRPVSSATSSKQSDVFPSPAVPVRTMLRNLAVAFGKQSSSSGRAG